MRELPQEERMDHRIEQGRVSKGHLEGIAGILADFHAGAESVPGELGSPQVVRENFSPAFKAGGIMDEYFKASDTVSMVRSRVEAFLRSHGDLFRKRIEQDRIKHCHGDVRTRNIFIRDDRIYIFDAIEFSTKISGCDVAAEIAFLAMDLEFFERGDLAEGFVEGYLSRTGDGDIMGLLDFYRCYRAMVEALVQSYQLADDEMGRDRKEKAARECRRYLDLAGRYAESL
jgi:aminoglycoside phosphotransferase family enzyme